MEFNEVVTRRRSVRRFSSAPVADETVKKLIECALQAPSSMNGQPWRFIVIRSQEIKKQIADMKDLHCPPEKRQYSAQFLVTTPVIIIICVDCSRSYDRGVENAALATGYLMLAAANYGLTSVYLSAYTTGRPEVDRDLRKILEIPDGFDPMTIVPIGYPGESPGPKVLKSINEVVFLETFGQK